MNSEAYHFIQKFKKFFNYNLTLEQICWHSCIFKKLFKFPPHPEYSKEMHCPFKYNLKHFL